MKKIFILAILIQFVLFNVMNAQKTMDGKLNFTALENGEIKNEKKINSKLIEFAPSWYDEGILFVSADSDKKRVKQKEGLNFKLQYSGINADGSFSGIADFDEIRKAGSLEGPVAQSGDKNWLFVTRNLLKNSISDEAPERKLGIFLYERVDGKWIDRGALPFNSVDYNICHPAWDDEKGRLLFASDMPGGFGKLDLYETYWKEEGNWSAITNLGVAINSPENDCFPFVKDQILFYSSNNHRSKGGLDFFCSAQEDDSWLPSVLLPGKLNSGADDLSLIIDDNGTKLIFASSRGGGSGMDDIYSMTVEESLFKEKEYWSSLIVKDRQSKIAVQACKVSFIKYDLEEATLIDNQDRLQAIYYNIEQESIKKSKPIYTDENGISRFQLPDGPYIVQLEKEGYFTKNSMVKIKGEGGDFLMEMDSIRCKQLIISLVDGKTDEALYHGDIRGNGILKTLQPGKDSVRFCVTADKTFTVDIAAEGFSGRTMMFEFDDINDGFHLIVSMQRVEKYVEVLPTEQGEILVLENILYAFNSADLNTKARKELDVLADHLKLFPDITIELSSHTDSRGLEAYNQNLSDLRSQKAKSYLVNKGVSADRIAAVGYGESRLRNNCSDGISCSEKEHSVNRRTEVKVITH